jgi:SAM-dependent methyltransferase
MRTPSASPAKARRFRSRSGAGSGLRAPQPGADFDRDYYQRYYFDARTAVASRSEMRARARLIAAMTQHAGLPVQRILEAGCGTGMLGAALRRLLPRAHYVGLEASEYLCRRYGWECGRVES